MTAASPTHDLHHRRIVVTGGFGALGRSVGTLLGGRGAKVLLLDRSAEAPGATWPDGVQALGGVDLADEAATRAAMDDAARRLGGLDGLVNVAGGFAWETLDGGSVATWSRMFDMNLRTAVLASQAALPHLLAALDASDAMPSAIVNVGALAAARPTASGMGAYTASKAGVARLTEAMAEEFKLRGLRVNAVLPSILDTPANRADMPDAAFDRWVKPEALARVVAFLLSREAEAVTGALVPVAGRV
jgi:NAD(P)-dependent dehydrogenase (short-subunit alcohol dehydrogenase family)